MANHDAIHAAIDERFAFMDDEDTIEREENEGLDESTVTMYCGFLKDFEKYLETKIREGTNPEYAHMLLTPRVQRRPRAEWPSMPQKKKHPCDMFKKTPINIDWTKFDVDTFKRWLIQKKKSLF